MDEAAVRGFADMINSSEGPPEGVPPSGIMVLSDSERGRSLVIGLFDTEEDLRAGDAALRALDRHADAQGEISFIDFYEVTVDRRQDEPGPALPAGGSGPQPPPAKVDASPPREGSPRQRRQE